MGSVNKVILVGNCGRDPEIRDLVCDALDIYVRVMRRLSDRYSREKRSKSCDGSFTVEPFEPFSIDATSQTGLSVKLHELAGGRDGDKRQPRSRLLAWRPDSGRSKSFFGSSKANKRNAP